MPTRLRAVVLPSDRAGVQYAVTQREAGAPSGPRANRYSFLFVSLRES